MWENDTGSRNTPLHHLLAVLLHGHRTLPTVEETTHTRSGEANEVSRRQITESLEDCVHLFSCFLIEQYAIASRSHYTPPARSEFQTHCDVRDECLRRTASWWMRKRERRRKPERKQFQEGEKDRAIQTKIIYLNIIWRQNELQRRKTDVFKCKKRRYFYFAIWIAFNLHFFPSFPLCFAVCRCCFVGVKVELLFAAICFYMSYHFDISLNVLCAAGRKLFCGWWESNLSFLLQVYWSLV